MVQWRNGACPSRLLFRRLEELRGGDPERLHEPELHFETDTALAGLVVSNLVRGRVDQHRQVVLGQTSKFPPLAQMVAEGLVMRSRHIRHRGKGRLSQIRIPRA